jgi:hypothetical protein
MTGITQGSDHQEAANRAVFGGSFRQITRREGAEVSVDEISMTLGTPYFSGRLPRTVIKA